MPQTHIADRPRRLLAGLLRKGGDVTTKAPQTFSVTGFALNSGFPARRGPVMRLDTHWHELVFRRLTTALAVRGDVGILLSVARKQYKGEEAR